MRQLKFRVWDTLAKHYIYTEDTLAAKHYIISLDGKVYNLQNGSGSPELVIQQAIGRKDKNGKDIYEGDIVSCDYYDGTFQIIWTEPDGDEQDDTLRSFEPKTKSGGGMCSYGEWYSNRVEIMGNIFQNPELLQN